MSNPYKHDPLFTIEDLNRRVAEKFLAEERKLHPGIIMADVETGRHQGPDMGRYVWMALEVLSEEINAIKNSLRRKI